MTEETNHTKDAEELSDAESLRGGNARRDLLFGLAAFLLFLIVSASVLVFSGAFSEGGNQASAEGLESKKVTFRLNVLHTNDTWGYLQPCG